MIVVVTRLFSWHDGTLSVYHEAWFAVFVVVVFVLLISVALNQAFGEDRRTITFKIDDAYKIENMIKLAQGISGARRTSDS